MRALQKLRELVYGVDIINSVRQYVCWGFMCKLTVIEASILLKNIGTVSVFFSLLTLFLCRWLEG